MTELQSVVIFMFCVGAVLVFIAYRIGHTSGYEKAVDDRIEEDKDKVCKLTGCVRPRLRVIRQNW